MTYVRGSEGYERSVGRFVELSQSLKFEDVCRDFLAFLPKAPGNVLDAGAGAGQNAAALAAMGYQVVAVDPMDAFLEAAQKAYSDTAIVWLNDSLPELKELATIHSEFDFILVDGVWHHLSVTQRRSALKRFWNLLCLGGRCALSLRNGPPGLGTCVYPTSASDTIRDAEAIGFEGIYLAEDQPSVLNGKEDVVWSRVVLERNSR